MEDENELDFNNLDSSPPPKKTAHKRKASKLSLSSKDNKRNIRIKKEAKENYDLHSTVKQESSEETLCENQKLNLFVVSMY